MLQPYCFLKINTNVNIRLLLVFAIFWLGGCNKEIITVGINGTLTGNVRSVGIPYGTNQDGAKIAVEGTSPTITALTDINGEFVIHDIISGTYDLVISREGYGTYKIIGFSFVGGKALTSISAMIYELPTVKIKDVTLSIAPYSNDYFQVDLVLDLPEGPYYSGYLRYYASNKSDVSALNYSETGIMGSYASQGNSNITVTKGINKAVFTPGSDLFIIIYLCREADLGYIDTNTGNMIYASISQNGSVVKRIKVP
jgi:hypothetical protein